MKTALYRHFDADGALLYVGISLSAVQRLAQHKRSAKWFAQIARVDVEWHHLRSLALSAEARAISTECPRFNVARPRCAAMPAITVPASRQSRAFAIVHVTTGRRDGNYFDERDANEMLIWWRAQFSGDQFELAPGDVPARPELRAYDLIARPGAGAPAVRSAT